MMNLLQILTPLYLLISLGFIFKHYHFPNDEFWSGLERLIYYVLFPSLLFVALLKAPINTTLLVDIVLVILLPTLFLSFTQWLGFFSPAILPTTFTSMYQGAVRNNTAIGLVLAPWISPEHGLTIMAVLILIMVPFNNIVSVMVLNHYGEVSVKNKGTWWKGVVYNPLIIACMAGLVLNLMGVILPRSLIDTADFLGKSALPLVLLAVGAGLKLGSAFQNKVAIALSSVVKLMLLPVLIWTACVLLEVSADTAKMAILLGALPTATSGYILAKQMGGDADVMAQIISFQTILAAFTLPIFIAITQSL